MNNGFTWLHTKTLIVLRTMHFRSQVWRWFWRSIRPGTFGGVFVVAKTETKDQAEMLVDETLMSFEELLQGGDEAASGQSELCQVLPESMSKRDNRILDRYRAKIWCWSISLQDSHSSSWKKDLGGRCARALCAEQNQFQSFDGVHAFQEDPALFSEHFQHRRRASASQIRSKHAKLLNHVGACENSCESEMFSPVEKGPFSKIKQLV